jgi:hypothetical protein
MEDSSFRDAQLRIIRIPSMVKRRNTVNNTRFCLFPRTSLPCGDLAGGRRTLRACRGRQEAAWHRSRGIGKCALGVFKRGAAAIGKYIGVAGEHLTGAQMACALSHALERPVVLESCPNCGGLVPSRPSRTPARDRPFFSSVSFRADQS